MRFTELKMTVEKVAAQAFVFFLAGFETSSTTMTFALYELAKNQEMQTELRREMDETLRKFGGFTYEAMQEMKYLDRIVSGKYKTKTKNDIRSRAKFPLKFKMATESSDEKVRFQNKTKFLTKREKFEKFDIKSFQM